MTGIPWHSLSPASPVVSTSKTESTSTLRFICSFRMFWSSKSFLSFCSCFLRGRILYFLCFIRRKVTRGLVLSGLEGTLLQRSLAPKCILSSIFALNRSWSACEFWLRKNHGCSQTFYRRSQITSLEWEPDISELRQKFIRNKDRRPQSPGLWMEEVK